MTTPFTSNDNTPAVTVENTDGGVGISAVSQFVAVEAEITGGATAVHARANGGGTAIDAYAFPDTDGNCRAGLFSSESKTLPTVQCVGAENVALYAVSNSNFGISGFSNLSAGVYGTSFESDGVRGESSRGMGVHGTNDAPQGGSIKPNYGCGVWGESTNGYGVFASSDNNVGLSGNSVNNIGVSGNSVNNVGVYGAGPGARGFLGGRDYVNNQLAGAYGESNEQGVYGYGTGDNGTGVYGVGTFGVRGETSTNIGVQGKSTGSTGVGVWGESGGGNGVFGVSHHHTFAGVAARNDGGGPAFWAEISGGGGLAGNFVGNVNVTGDITVGGDIYLSNRDLAERFEAVNEYDHGTVMVIGDDGRLQPCTKCYDRRAIGVVAGAGTLKPAITLGAFQDDVSTANISLVGTAFCWVDAEEVSIEVGDLLTTSNVTGHAMKADDAARSFGAVIGKALAPLLRGQGLIPIIVTLQ